MREVAATDCRRPAPPRVGTGRWATACGAIVTMTVLLAAAPGGAQEAVPAFPDRFVVAALERTGHDVTYDGRYRRLEYPGGDVPDDAGVCTDVVIRSYRAIGVDLQRLVHEDMRGHFDEYPDLWGLTAPDPNIDHRRVPNLEAFLRRQGAELPVSDEAGDYRAGDLVTWMLPGNLPHIGVVVDRRSADDERPLLVHNIGRGPKLEDVLFAYPITGHFRYAGPE